MLKRTSTIFLTDAPMQTILAMTKQKMSQEFSSAQQIFLVLYCVHFLLFPISARGYFLEFALFHLAYLCTLNPNIYMLSLTRACLYAGTL